MLKSRLSWVSAAAVALALTTAACGEDDNGAAGGASAGEGRRYTVAFIPGCTCDPYYSTQIAGFEDAARKEGITPIVQGAAKFDPAEQTPVLQAVVRRKPDAIVIDPTDAKAMIAPIRQAVAQDIPVMTTGNEIDADLAFTKIAASSVEGGRLAARTIREMAGDRTGPVLINDVQPGISSLDDRRKGFNEGMKGAAGLEVLKPQFNGNDQAKASSITSATLRSNPDLVGIFATNVISAQGVANALRTAGKDVIAVGYDASPQLITALEAGQLKAVISQDPRKIGRLAVDNAKRYLDGDKGIPRDQPQTPLVITQENLDTPEAQSAIYR